MLRAPCILPSHHRAKPHRLPSRTSSFHLCCVGTHGLWETHLNHLMSSSSTLSMVHGSVLDEFVLLQLPVMELWHSASCLSVWPARCGWMLPGCVVGLGTYSLSSRDWVTIGSVGQEGADIYCPLCLHAIHQAQDTCCQHV